MSTREELVVEARSWLGTPYLYHQMLKGVGCDCATLILGILQNCGFAADDTSRKHAINWFQHTDEDRYLKRALRHATMILRGISYHTLQAGPGDIVLTKAEPCSRVFNHAGLVTRWPRLIHAMKASGVEEIDATQHYAWNYREVAVLSLFEEVTP